MPNINAALVAQLEVLKDRLRKKANLYKLFQHEFKNVEGIELLKDPKNTISNHWLIAIRLMHNDPKGCEELVERILNYAHCRVYYFVHFGKNLILNQCIKIILRFS